MKRFFSLLIICSIIGQASVRTLWTLHYQLDRVAYLKKCENKDKPKLHCDGKCYLKKQMGVKASDNSKEPSLPDSFREIKDLQLYCESMLPSLFLCAVAEPRQALPPFLFPRSRALLMGVFRPPAMVWLLRACLGFSVQKNPRQALKDHLFPSKFF